MRRLTLCLMVAAALAGCGKTRNDVAAYLDVSAVVLMQSAAATQKRSIEIVFVPRLEDLRYRPDPTASVVAFFHQQADPIARRCKAVRTLHAIQARVLAANQEVMRLHVSMPGSPAAEAASNRMTAELLAMAREERRLCDKYRLASRLQPRP